MLERRDRMAVIINELVAKNGEAVDAGRRPRSMPRHTSRGSQMSPLVATQDAPTGTVTDTVYPRRCDLVNRPGFRALIALSGHRLTGIRFRPDTWVTVGDLSLVILIMDRQRVTELPQRLVERPRLQRLIPCQRQEPHRLVRVSGGAGLKQMPANVRGVPVDLGAVDALTASATRKWARCRRGNDRLLSSVCRINPWANVHRISRPDDTARISIAASASSSAVRSASPSASPNASRRATSKLRPITGPKPHIGAKNGSESNGGENVRSRP